MKTSSPAICPGCGATLNPDDRYCQSCGTAAAGAAATCPDETITWERDIALVTNPLIMRQTLLVAVGAGLLMAFLMSFIFAATGEFDAIPPILLVSALGALGLGLFMLLIMALFFGNRIRVRFTLDAKGALWETVDKRATSANRLAMLGGILGRSAATAGAGAAAAAREREFVRWEAVDHVEIDEARRMITLRNSWRPVMMVVCLPENFTAVCGHLRRRIKPVEDPGGQPVRRKALARPLLSALTRTAAVSAAALPLFMLSNHPVELELFLPLLMFCFALATVWLIPLFGWVVLPVAAVLAVQITWAAWGGFYHMDGWERIVLLLAYAGLAWLAWFCRGALHGRFLPPLLQD